MGFTKLDSGIVDSSIWSEPPATRVVWVTFLAKSDSKGFVGASRSGMIRASNVSPEDFDRAIDTLESPDSDSRSTENDGRRLEKVEGGWLIVNYLKYREYSYSDNPDAVRQRRHREKEKNNGVTLCDMSRTPRDISASASSSASASGINSFLQECGDVEGAGTARKQAKDAESFPDIPKHFSDVWPAFLEVRRAKKAVHSPRAIRSILNELSRLSTNQDEQVRIIEQSIRNSWKDVYELKRGSNAGSGAGRGSFAWRPGYDENGRAIGAVAKPGEFDEGTLTLDGVRDK